LRFLDEQRDADRLARNLLLLGGALAQARSGLSAALEVVSDGAGCLRL